jgi:predicted nuclease with RNAse H fold
MVGTVISLGIDVGVRKGLHLVALDAQLKPLLARSGVRVEKVAAICESIKPDVVMIDSPPGWGLRKNQRRAERDLQSRGIHLFATPSDPEKQRKKFYEWMKSGFKVYDAVASRFPRYKGKVRDHAVEVFPYASAVYLAGSLMPKGTSKVQWRRLVLKGEGIDIGPLTNVDLVDAGLAALTGLYALRDDFTPFGDPQEGVIVVPRRSALQMQFTKPA